MASVTAEPHPTLAETASRAWNRLPSRWKVLIPAIGGLLLMLVPATLLIGSRIYAVTTDNLRAQHKAFLTDVGSTFEDFLNRHASYLAGFATSDALEACAKLETGCTEQAQNVFGSELGRKITDPSGYYTEIGFIDNNFKETASAVRGSGNVVTVTNTAPTLKIDPEALKALPDVQVYVFPISRDTRLAANEPYQHPLLRMASPVSSDGKRTGYVTAALNLDDFFAQNFVFSDQQQSSLLDSEGCLLASSDDSRRGGGC